MSRQPVIQTITQNTSLDRIPSNNGVLVDADTSVNPIAATLPPLPYDGQDVFLARRGINAMTILPGSLPAGSTIGGNPVQALNDGDAIHLRYEALINQWRILGGLGAALNFPLLPNVLFCDALAPAGGDGSIASPFNAISQALAVVNAAAANQAWQIVASGTFAPENVSISPARSVFFMGMTLAEFQGDITINKNSVPETTLPIIGFVRFTISSGSLLFRQDGPGISTTYVFANIVDIDGNIAQDAINPDLGGVFLEIYRAIVFDNFGTGFAIDHTGLQFAMFAQCQWGATVRSLAVANGARSSFTGDVIVTSVGGIFAPFHLTDCQISGDWTGPALSANWDRVTFRSFLQAGGALLGGATVDLADSDAVRLIRSEVIGATPSIPQLDNAVFNVDSDAIPIVTLPAVTASHDGMRTIIKRRVGSLAMLTIAADPGQFIDGLAAQTLLTAGDALALVVDLASGGWSIV